MYKAAAKSVVVDTDSIILDVVNIDEITPGDGIEFIIDDGTWSVEGNQT